MAAPESGSAADDELLRLLRGLNIGVGSNSSSAGREAPTTLSSDGQPPKPQAPTLPLTDQLSLLSAHIDNVRGQIAATVSSEQGRALIEEHMRRAKDIQSRFASLDERLTDIDSTHDTATDGDDSLSALQESVLGGLASYTQAQQAYLREQDAGQLARVLHSCVAAVETLEEVISASRINVDHVAAALAEVDRTSASFGLSPSTTGDSDSEPSSFRWIGASGSMLPQAVSQLVSRIAQARDRYTEILNVAWQESIKVMPATEGHTSVSIQHDISITISNHSTSISLRDLTRALQQRNDFSPRIESLSKTLLSEVLEPTLNSITAQEWIQRDDAQSWTCVSRAQDDGSIDRRRKSIESALSLFSFLHKELFDDHIISNASDTQHALAKNMLPKVVVLLTTSLSALLPSQLELSSETLQQALEELDMVKITAQQCHKLLKDAGFLEYGLNEEAEDLLSFSHQIGRSYMRQLGNLARARCRDILLKEQTGGWESVTVEMDIQVTATQAAQELARANAAEDNEVEQMLQADDSRSKPTTEVGEVKQVEEGDAWDAWNEDDEDEHPKAAAKSAKVATLRSYSRASSQQGSRTHTPTTRQKRSALGGVRVVNPRDELGSGPFPADFVEDFDDDGWGFDDEVVMPADGLNAMSNAAKVEDKAIAQNTAPVKAQTAPAPALDDDDDAWFQDEAPSLTAPTAESTAPLASNTTKPDVLEQSTMSSMAPASMSTIQSVPATNSTVPQASSWSNAFDEFDDEDIDEDAWGLSEEKKVQLAAKRASIRASRSDLASAFNTMAPMKETQEEEGQGTASGGTPLSALEEEEHVANTSHASDASATMAPGVHPSFSVDEPGIHSPDTSQPAQEARESSLPMAVATDSDEDDEDDPWDMSPAVEARPHDAFASEIRDDRAAVLPEIKPGISDSSSPSHPAETEPTAQKASEETVVGQSADGLDDGQDDPWDLSPIIESQPSGQIASEAVGDHSILDSENSAERTKSVEVADPLSPGQTPQVHQEVERAIDGTDDRQDDQQDDPWDSPSSIGLRPDDEAESDLPEQNLHQRTPPIDVEDPTLRAQHTPDDRDIEEGSTSLAEVEANPVSDPLLQSLPAVATIPDERNVEYDDSSTQPSHLSHGIDFEHSVDPGVQEGGNIDSSSLLHALESNPEDVSVQEKKQGDDRSDLSLAGPENIATAAPAAPAPAMSEPVQDSSSLFQDLEAGEYGSAPREGDDPWDSWDLSPVQTAVASFAAAAEEGTTGVAPSPPAAPPSSSPKLQNLGGSVIAHMQLLDDGNAETAQDKSPTEHGPKQLPSLVQEEPAQELASPSETASVERPSSPLVLQEPTSVTAPDPQHAIDAHYNAYDAAAEGNEPNYASALFADSHDDADPWDIEVQTPVAPEMATLPASASGPIPFFASDESQVASHPSTSEENRAAAPTADAPSIENISQHVGKTQLKESNEDDLWDMQDDAAERQDILSGSEEGARTGESGEKSISSGEKLSDVPTEAWDEFTNSERDSQHVSRSSSRGPHAAVVAGDSLTATTGVAAVAAAGVSVAAEERKHHAPEPQDIAASTNEVQKRKEGEQKGKDMPALEPVHDQGNTAPSGADSADDHSTFDAWGWEDEETEPAKAQETAQPTSISNAPASVNRPSKRSSVENTAQEATPTSELSALATTSLSPSGSTIAQDATNVLSPAMPHPTPASTKEKCMISQRSLAFLGLVTTLLDDICLLLKTGTGQALSSSDVKGLCDALKDVLDLHQALMPVSHAETLQNVPTLAAQFANDCAYIAKDLEKLDERWTTESQSITASHNLGDLSLREHAAYAVVLGQRTFDAQILIQQQALAECLAETQGFEATYEDQRFRICQRSMQQVVTIIKQLGRAWSPPVLGRSRYQAAMGRIIDSVLRRVLRDISTLEDISEVEGNRLAELLKSLTEVEDLFRSSDAPADGEPSSDVAVHVPSWFKASYLVDILTGSLVDIEFLYFEAQALVDYSKPELVRLIRALFSDSPKRARLIDRIQQH